MKGRSHRARAAAIALLATLGLLVVPGVWGVVVAQMSAPTDPRLAGLQWTFVRVRYHSPSSPMRFRADYYGEPWAIDSPAADHNLTRRVRTATALDVGEPIIGLPLDDPQLWAHPWIYFVEPGNLELRDNEVPILREFLLRGGTATFDDFHGPYEWANLEKQLHKVFPDKKIVDIPSDHPIFRCFYTFDRYPQNPGLGSFLAGRTWEKGGFVSHLRTIWDDNGRPMVLINWNTDMGDGWEWSNSEEYPAYIKYSAVAYRMMINEIVYVLTH